MCSGTYHFELTNTHQKPHVRVHINLKRITNSTSNYMLWHASLYIAEAPVAGAICTYHSELSQIVIDVPVQLHTHRLHVVRRTGPFLSAGVRGAPHGAGRSGCAEWH